MLAPATNLLQLRSELSLFESCYRCGSWRDDGDMKYAKLHEHEWGKAEPTIWLDKVFDCAALIDLIRTTQHNILSTDHMTCCDAILRLVSQACIDQSNIDASLAVLPIFLAGCQKLLILPGPSYATRLWVRVQHACHPFLSGMISEWNTHGCMLDHTLAVCDGGLHLRADGWR